MSKRRDFRSFRPEEQVAIRRKAVDMVISGKSRIEVAKAVGVNRRFIGAWVSAFRANGESALEGRSRGSRPGDGLYLSSNQSDLILHLISSQPPDQLGLPFKLWTRKAIRQLIERQTDIKLSLSSVSTYLARWGIVETRSLPSKGLIQAIDLKSAKCVDYSEISKQAKACKAIIYRIEIRNIIANKNCIQRTQNSNTIQDDSHSPIIPRNIIESYKFGRRDSFLVYQGLVSRPDFVDFTDRLVKQSGAGAFIILGPEIPLHCRSVDSGLLESDQIRTFLLSPSS
jgi:transposase